MAKKITLDELRAKMADPATTKDDLAPYFTIADDSAPFNPVLAVDPSKVEVPNTATGRERSAQVLNWANSWSRNDRRRRFEQKIASGYDGPVIVSEGDSWFQFPIKLDDVIDVLLEDYAICSLDAAGDTLQNMIAEAEYGEALERTKASILLFSGGGNDLVAGGHLADHLRSYERGLDAAQLLLPSFRRVLGDALGWYDRLFRDVEKKFPDVTVITHGYDRVIPAQGRWLGAPMQSKGIDDPALQQAIAALMLDRFNDGLKQLADGFHNVVFLDNRGTVAGSQWYDELHPNDAGYRAVAGHFETAIVSAAKSHRGRPAAAARERPAAGAAATARRARAPDAAAAPRGRKALSLHVGLNSVDAKHYQGWEGPLRSCEYDAKDMQAIADRQGYASKLLLTKDATAAAVKKEIAAAAASLDAGDIFFVSYSGHGGTLPDYNGDEDDLQDETWCLYDREFIDDELYFLWRDFKRGVRILVVSDSCHSGSVVRARPAADLKLCLSPWPDGRPRMMPDDVAGRVFRENRKKYEDIVRDLPPVEPDFGRAVTHPLQATVRLLSGCQDNQLSIDLPTNGAFTHALLSVWNDGRFRGSYAEFHAQIRRTLPPTQVPNHMVVGQSSAVFDRQKPFSV